MPKETGILDQPLSSEGSNIPSTLFLMLKGCFYLTLLGLVVLLGNGLLLLLPIGGYFFLLAKHRAILAEKGIGASMLIGSTWLALPTFPLIMLLLLYGGGVFAPNLAESLAIAAVLTVIFFLIGGVMGFIAYAIFT